MFNKIGGILASNNKDIASTQTHLEIAQIREGVLVLKDGTLKMIMSADSVNFSLKSEEEQNAIVSGYQSFLNSLVFPIQIIMQSRRLDLDKYLTNLEKRLDEEINDLIRIQIVDYVNFIQKLLTVVNIMDKRFYIVVPYSTPAMKKRDLFDKIFHPSVMITPQMSKQEFHAHREELIERCGVISSGLGSLGIKTEILSTQKVIELFYNAYNPEESGKEKLVGSENLEAPIIEKSSQEGV